MSRVERSGETSSPGSTGTPSVGGTATPKPLCAASTQGKPYRVAQLREALRRLPTSTAGDP